MKVHPNLAQVRLRVGVGGAAELTITAHKLALLPRGDRVDSDEHLVVLPRHALVQPFPLALALLALPQMGAHSGC